MAINNSTNAALLAVRILASSGQYPGLAKEIREYSKNLELEVMAKVEKLESIGWEAYVKK